MESKTLKSIFSLSCFMTILIIILITVNIILIHYIRKPAHEFIVYGYECKQNKCVKIELDETNFEKAVSLSVCRIFCGENIGTLWPKPSGEVKLDTYMAHINSKRIDFDFPRIEGHLEMWKESKERLMNQIHAQVPDLTLLKDEGRLLNIKLLVEDDATQLTMNTDESYTLKLSVGNNEVFAEISAKTYFGARHGLETLSQLIVYDDIRRQIQVPAEAEIHDKPAYPHRGLLLDTSRNYFSVDSIKKTIDGMAMTKLNTFHWHITDSHSFPLVIKSRPDLYKLGAYSSRQIYTPEDVKEIVNFARVRGVRVIPEFDAPAHVGEGWQKTNMTVCFGIQPWNQYCVEPPCGQLNPTISELYDVLQDIYREMLEMFQHPDIFHMGGDEVSNTCWNTSEQIQNWMKERHWELNNDGFVQLWGHFQDNALERVDRVSESKLPIIMWTSHLTEKEYIEKYLDKNRYIIQVWTTGQDVKVKTLLQLGYRLILSNYDALYFDCGGAGWVNDGNNWCSPYIGWQKVYENRPKKIAGEYLNQILGSEAAIWSEQIDDTTLDARFWPRASALAERLWSDPDESWRKAESRLLLNRKRLVENGIQAEAMQPQWCLQNEGECPIVRN
ncbi:chitooligosaccharidolytic beta-N-acetylglucosaminidase-like isoform X1 [Condylostylus longicornis]|uniref:chitooligosaccharidolytic beta-N-acetylglucosaminidase-like isoform X1 n=1 Tax=Condylostylus longicornis TaxID=2530218 RepID=UPI00244DA7B0|nr:chitooligosaccharidolytic beta-N-acetylglucosaminidase-like isoform X1 [Condylostylus longicornis]